MNWYIILIIILVILLIWFWYVFTTKDGKSTFLVDDPYTNMYFANLARIMGYRPHLGINTAKRYVLNPYEAGVRINDTIGIPPNDIMLAYIDRPKYTYY